MKKTTSNALQILNRITGDDPHLRALIKEEHKNLDIAHQIIALRKTAGLSQRALANRIGTTQSVISRLEDSDYDGQSLPMLRKIASAVGMEVDLQFVAPRARTLQPA